MLQSTSLLRGKTYTLFRLSQANIASIHFPLAREDENGNANGCHANALQSTSLLRGKTEVGMVWDNRNFSFNPLPSCEGRLTKDLCAVSMNRASIHFPLAREDVINSEAQRRANVLQSTSLLRGKTQHSIINTARQDASIHFPLAREDRI